WVGGWAIVRRFESSKYQQTSVRPARPLLHALRRRRLERGTSSHQALPEDGARPIRLSAEDIMGAVEARASCQLAEDFYVDALRRLQDTGIPFLLGGSYAFSYYAHVPRDTKDIDVFVRPEDCSRVLESFERLGYLVEVRFPHWLGKIHRGEHFMDVIFNSGNGLARVDDLWFAHAPVTEVLGLLVRLSPAEEMIWSKAFIQ